MNTWNNLDFGKTFLYMKAKFYNDVPVKVISHFQFYSFNFLCCPFKYFDFPCVCHV